MPNMQEYIPGYWEKIFKSQLFSPEVSPGIVGGAWAAKKPWLQYTQPQPAEWSYGELVGGPTGIVRGTQWPDEIYGKIPQWVRDAAKKEKISYATNRELAMLWSQKTGRDWMLYPGWELMERGAYEKLDRFAQKPMQLWQQKQMPQRGKFYELLEPRAFGEEFLAERGYEYQKGRLVKIGAKRAAPVLKTLPRDIAAWEQAAYARTTPGAFERLISREKPLDYYAKYLQGENWIVGRSAEKIHFMTPRQQTLWGREVYGQTRYLQDVATGKPMLLGARNILGVRRPVDLTRMGFAREMADIAAREPGEAFAELVHRYRRWGVSEDPTYRRLADYLGPKLERLGERGTFRPGWSVNIRSRNFADIHRRMGRFSEQIATIAELQRAIGREAKATIAAAGPVIDRFEKPIRDLKGAVKLVENLATSDEVVMTGGKIGRVAAIEGAHQISVQTATGRPAWLPTIMERFEQRYAPNYLTLETLPVRLVRDPITVAGKAYPLNVRVLTPSGTQIATVQDAFAARFAPGVKRGLLPIENMMARIYPAGDKISHPLVSLFEKGKIGRKMWPAIPLHMRMTGTRYYLDPIKKLLSGEGAEYLAAVDLAKRYPTKYKIPERISAKMLAGIPKPAQNMLIAATVAAGALLLWSAFRQRRARPLDERDVPASMHGEPVRNRMFQDNLPTYQPTARITQNAPAAFSTNIDLETEDYNNVMDYRQLANTMSTLSRGALGVERANVDLHVVDNSKDMNPYAMQRQFVEYLNR